MYITQRLVFEGLAKLHEIQSVDVLIYTYTAHTYLSLLNKGFSPYQPIIMLQKNLSTKHNAIENLSTIIMLQKNLSINRNAIENLSDDHNAIENLSTNRNAIENLSDDHNTLLLCRNFSNLGSNRKTSRMVLPNIFQGVLLCFRILRCSQSKLML